MPKRILLALALLTLPLMAAERKFDFSAVREGQTPPGFRSTVTGQGKPGDWRVIMDDVPSLLPALTPGARGVAKKAVLAQLAQDATDEHFPLLIYEGETMDDFTLTTRFKTVKGVMEQMAGIAFRIQNETNYYVVRASSLGNTFRFYKVLNGERGPLVGPEVPIPSGVWHDLTVECKGNQIRCLLDGKELISATDKVNPFTSGKIGFWTKSDAVSYFADTRIVYTPHEAPAQALVRADVEEVSAAVGSAGLCAGRRLEVVAAVGQQEHERCGPGRRKGRAERNCPGHDLLRQRKGLGLCGYAFAGSEWGPYGCRACDHEDFCRSNGTECLRPGAADHSGDAGAGYVAAGFGQVSGRVLSN